MAPADFSFENVGEGCQAIEDKKRQRRQAIEVLGEACVRLSAFPSSLVVAEVVGDTVKEAREHN